MKLIKPSVEILEQAPGLQGIYDMIELCGKTSYKSPVKGGDEAKKFVDARINEGHFAVLEFGTVYLDLPYWGTDTYTAAVGEAIEFFKKNPYSRIIDVRTSHRKVTTNLRVLAENNLMFLLDYMVKPDKHLPRYCAHIVTNIGITRELCRHRTFSFCEQSTRYCNYTKDKFDNNVSFVIPSWSENIQECTLEEFKPDTCPFFLDAKELYLLKSWKDAESNYYWMLKWFAVPQEARACLPLGTATEICVCGFEDAWRHFFDLRYRGTTGKPHPDMLEVATMLHKEFEAKGISL